MFETLNIYLELDAVGEYLFNILSEEQLKIKISQSKERILNVKEKIDDPTMILKEYLSNVRVYLEVRKSLLPFESVFVKEEPVDVKPELHEILKVPKLPRGVTMTIVEEQKETVTTPKISVQNEEKRSSLTLKRLKIDKNVPSVKILKMLDSKLLRVDEEITQKKSNLCLEPTKNVENVPLEEDKHVKVASNSTIFIYDPFKRSNFDYLPEDVSIPSHIKTLKPPFHVNVKQPDGSTVYFNRVSRKGTLLISNFDLHSNICDLCGQKFKHPFYTSLVQHRSHYHFFPGNRQNCVCCDKLFAHPEARLRHSLFCTEKSKLDVSFCYICDIELDDFFMLRQHLQSFHPIIKNTPNPEKRPCYICREIVSASLMKEHILRHKDAKPYKCNECQIAFITKKTLKSHLMSKHFHDLCLYKCTDCYPTKHFELISTLLSHRRKKHYEGQDEGTKVKKKINPKIEKCQKCGKLLKKYLMKKHMESHENADAMFVTNQGKTCDVCGKIFTSEIRLNHHMKNHLPESERPFKCMYCAKGFNSSKPLIEHERSHTGEKPLVCPYCQKAFARQQTYTDHVKTHTGDGYKCEHCEKKLSDHSSLRKHLKVHEKKLGIKLTYTKNERRWKDMGLYEKAKDFI